MSRKILVVEDEPYLQDLYTMTLSTAGFEVASALDGDEGVRLALKSPPDLIYLDIMLPKKNGIDVLRELKKNETTKDIPVVMLTNLGQESILNEAMNLGASEYIIKVRIDPFELVDKAKAILGEE